VDSSSGADFKALGALLADRPTGRFLLNQQQSIVAKGLGTSVLPVRWGARAEVAVFDL
jgi:hypothetical protein